MDELTTTSSLQTQAGRAPNSWYLSRYKTYVTQHRGIKYFRITVPDHLRFLINKTEIRRSLDGLKSRAARRKAARLSVAAQTFFAVVDEIRTGRIQLLHGTCTQPTEILSGIVRKLDTFWFTAACENDLSCAALVLKLPEFLKEILPEFDGMVQVASVPIYPTEQTGTTCCEVAADYTGSHSQSTERHEALIPSKQESSNNYAKISKSKSAAIKLPTLFKAAQDYIQAKSLTWSKGSKKAIPPQIEQFVQIIRELEGGKDIGIDELSRDHIRKYSDILKNLPARVNDKYRSRKMNWSTMADLGRAGKLDRLLSLKTMQVRQINVRSFINWCELEYQGKVMSRYLNSGFPAAMSNRDIRRKGTKRVGFTIDDLKALFGNKEMYIKETRGSDARFWCPWIALYTGMRIEEICQLHIADIRVVDGVMCFSVNEENEKSAYDKHVKTIAGIRNVPVHPWLWNEGGFGKYVEARKAAIPEKKWASTLLFTDMQNRTQIISSTTVSFSAPITSWFLRYRRKCSIGGEHGQTSEKTFHSFRHTVVEYLLKEARVPLSMVQTIVGHEQTDMGITEIYAGDWSTKALLDEGIMKLNWYVLL